MLIASGSTEIPVLSLNKKVDSKVYKERISYIKHRNTLKIFNYFKWIPKTK